MSASREDLIEIADNAERYGAALRKIARADYRGNRSPLSQIALEALYPEPRPCRLSGPGCHNATPESCCVDRGMEPS